MLDNRNNKTTSVDRYCQPIMFIAGLAAVEAGSWGLFLHWQSWWRKKVPLKIEPAFTIQNSGLAIKHGGWELIHPDMI